MGITLYKRRSLLCDYLLCINAISPEIDSDKNGLLERMCQALHWPLDATQRVILIGSVQEKNTLFWDKITEYQPKKILLFCDAAENSFVDATHNPMRLPGTGRACVVGLLPSVEQLLRDPAAKKQAWKIMQNL